MVLQHLASGMNIKAGRLVPSGGDQDDPLQQGRSLLSFREVKCSLELLTLGLSCVQPS